MKEEEFSETVVKNIISQSWESIASIVINLEIDVGKKDRETKKLEKKLHLLRYILNYNLRNSEDSSAFFHGCFFISMVKTVNKIEKEFESNNIKKNAFLIFLKVLLHKAKKQPIVVQKPMEKKASFTRMKNIIENGYESKKQSPDSR